MKINKENIKIEMTTREHFDTIRCLWLHAESSHISLLSAENRGVEKHVEFATAAFKRAVACYEGMSGKTYDIYEQELKLVDRIPSLKRF